MRHVIDIKGEQVECDTERTTRYGGPWVARTEMHWANGKSEREALRLLAQFLEEQAAVQMCKVGAA